MFFWTGFELAFWTGEFPQLLSPDVIGLVLMIVGVAEITSGIIMGKVSDHFGRIPTILCGTAVYTFGLLLSGLLKGGYWLLPTVAAAPWSSYVAALCFGFGDCVFNTQVYAVLGDFYPAKSIGAFTLFQLFQNLGSAVGFYYAIVVPLHGTQGTLIQLWVQFFILLLSTITFVLACSLHSTQNKIAIN